MIEIAVGLGVCFIMAKIADMDRMSPIIWFVITFALCLAALLIPIPYARFLIAGFVSFIVMIVYKAVSSR